MRRSKSPLRQFETEDASVAEFRRKHAASADHERSLVEQCFDVIGVDAGQSDQNEYLAVGLQNVYRRFPARLARSGQRLQVQELLMQPFGAGECLDSVGQHPVDGILGRHCVSPRLRIYRCCFQP